MDRVIRIGDREVPMRATAATVRHYRTRLGRDLLADLVDTSGPGAMFSYLENLAYIMAWQADPELPDTVEGWLDSFDNPMALLDAQEAIMGLWNANQQTLATGKKKAAPPSGA